MSYFFANTFSNNFLGDTPFFYALIKGCRERKLKIDVQVLSLIFLKGYLQQLTYPHLLF
jgi:hypothetical protein